MNSFFFYFIGFNSLMFSIGLQQTEIRLIGEQKCVCDLISQHWNEISCANWIITSILSEFTGHLKIKIKN